MKRVLPSKTLSSDINGQIITALLKEYCCIFLDIQDVQHAITVLASYQRILKARKGSVLLVLLVLKIGMSGTYYSTFPFSKHNI